MVRSKHRHKKSQPGTDQSADDTLRHTLSHELPQDVSLGRAHRASTPISLFRAVTLTSITFMITIPPMMTEIALTMMNTAKNAPLILLQRAM